MLIKFFDSDLAIIWWFLFMFLAYFINEEFTLKYNMFELLA